MCIFVLAILKTNLLSHHLSKRNFILNLDFQRFLFISETTRTNLVFLSSNNASFAVSSLIAPCKGIQDSLGFWIPRRGFPIPRNWIPGTWILDCNLQKDCEFFELLLPIPQAKISGIPESGLPYSFFSPQFAQCMPSARSLTDFPVLNAFFKRLHFPL